MGPHPPVLLVSVLLPPGTQHVLNQNSSSSLTWLYFYQCHFSLCLGPAVQFTGLSHLANIAQVLGTGNRDELATDPALKRRPVTSVSHASGSVLSASAVFTHFIPTAALWGKH